MLCYINTKTTIPLYFIFFLETLPVVCVVYLCSQQTTKYGLNYASKLIALYGNLYTADSVQTQASLHFSNCVGTRIVLSIVRIPNFKLQVLLMALFSLRNT